MDELSLLISYILSVCIINNIIDRLCYSTPKSSHKAPKLTTINRDSVEMGQTLATTTVIGGRSNE